MFIGITGTNGAGKGTVAEYFVNKGFAHFVSSDLIREYLTKEELEHTRDNMIVMGKKLREEKGLDFIVETFFERANNKDSVLESIRSIGEVESLKRHKAILIAVDAPVEERYKRVIGRKSSKDSIDFDTFKQQEELEMKGTGGGQQIALCMDYADYKIMNDGSFDDLNSKISAIYKDIKKKFSLRPSWDEYFMKMAFMVSERSTCLRHHVGAVMVRDKRVLTTGYNGAASGTKDCLELGCLRNELNIPSGTRHEICRAIHAEQNAVIQGGLYGVKLEGATVYCTHSPCILCAKILANTKIKRLVASIEYPDKSFIELFNEAGIEYKRMDMPDMEIDVLK